VETPIKLGFYELLGEQMIASVEKAVDKCDRYGIVLVSTILYTGCG